MRHRGPVRVGAGAQAQPLDAVARCARRCSSSRRAGSRRGRCRSAAPALPASRPRARCGRRAGARAGRTSARARARAARIVPARRLLRVPARPARSRHRRVAGCRRGRRPRARQRARPARPRRAERAAAASTTPMSGSLSWKERLKRTRASRSAPRLQAQPTSPAAARASSRCAVSVASRRRWIAAEEETVTCELGVESARALGERSEVIVSGGKADACADRGEVVEMAPHALELEQDRAHARELGAGSEAERVLTGEGVRNAVRDCAGGARARCVRESVAERLPFRRALEAAVLVEEPCVEVQDALADDVEPEMAGLDDRRRGSARPRPGTRRGRAPARSSARGRGRGRRAAAEAGAPRRRRPGGRAPRARPSRRPGRDRRSKEPPVLDEHGLQPSLAVADRRAASARRRRPGRVEPREAPASRERRRDRARGRRAVRARSRDPLQRARRRASEPGSQSADGRERRAAARARRRRGAPSARRPRGRATSRRRALPTVVSSSA